MITILVFIPKMQIAIQITTLKLSRIFDCKKWIIFQNRYNLSFAIMLLSLSKKYYEL